MICTETRENVTSELFRAPTSDELELARLQVDLESRRSELERLEAERDTLEIALTRFAADVKVRIETTYNAEVATVLPHSDELMLLASASIFVLQYPQHPVTAAYQQLAAKLMEA